MNIDLKKNNEIRFAEMKTMKIKLKKSNDHRFQEKQLPIFEESSAHLKEKQKLIETKTMKTDFGETWDISVLYSIKYCKTFLAPNRPKRNMTRELKLEKKYIMERQIQ